MRQGGTTEVQQGKGRERQGVLRRDFHVRGNEIQITYAGQITSDDEIKFMRTGADFATEELLAKRVK
jgi:hypothetical protein